MHTTLASLFDCIIEIMIDWGIVFHHLIFTFAILGITSTLYTAHQKMEAGCFFTSTPASTELLVATAAGLLGKCALHSPATR